MHHGINRAWPQFYELRPADDTGLAVSQVSLPSRLPLLRLPALVVHGIVVQVMSTGDERHLGNFFALPDT